MLIRWPGHTKSGSLIATPVWTLDLMPTLIEMAGLTAPKNVGADGLSLAGLIEVKPAPTRDTFYWHNPPHVPPARATGSPPPSASAT